MRKKYRTIERINWLNPIADCVIIICSVWLRGQGFSLWWLFLIIGLIASPSSKVELKEEIVK